MCRLVPITKDTGQKNGVELQMNLNAHFTTQDCVPSDLIFVSCK